MQFPERPFPYFYRCLVFFFCFLAGIPQVYAAPDAVLDPFWKKFNAENKKTIDHGAWQIFLDKYVIKDARFKQNLLAYKKVSVADKKRLEEYLRFLQSLDPRAYSQSEQKAFWLNFYNALTVNLILDNYPVDSITDIKKRFYHFGPWNDEIASVQGKQLSLNDIEHRILRPIWQDPRIHYGVNCASKGCPDLLTQAFTGNNTEALLDQAARIFINHHRGVAFVDGQLKLSRIYDWYQVDFGDSEFGVIKHLMHYAQPALKEQLKNYRGRISYQYDWQLNEKY